MRNRLFSSISLYTITTSLILSLATTYTFLNKSTAKPMPSALHLQYTHLLAQPDKINIAWMHTMNPIVSDAQGSILWSTTEQQGMMTLKGLPRLENGQQYRLWIYDLENQHNNRISSGIFKNKSRNGDAWVMTVKPETAVSTPFKFELVLEETNNIESLLLLAQP